MRRASFSGPVRDKEPGGPGPCVALCRQLFGAEPWPGWGVGGGGYGSVLVGEREQEHSEIPS